MSEQGDEFEVIEFPWGNPLDLKWYKVSKGLAEEIHELMKTVYTSHILASTCNCEACKKIKEITNLPIYG